MTADQPKPRSRRLYVVPFESSAEPNPASVALDWTIAHSCLLS
jgi:hypothetical protein